MNDKARKIVFRIFLIAIIIMVAFFTFAAFKLSPKSPNNESNVIFEIKEGTGRSKIADDLEKSKLIKSSFFLKLYLKMDNKPLYAGTFKLSPSMCAIEIVEKIQNQDSLENETNTITFIEGKRLTTYVKQIAESFPYTEEEIMNRLTDSEFLSELIDKYWFISKDILNEQIYYPLEGYFYPDTYAFKKTSTIDEIIIKVLDNMDNKLTQYQEEIELSNYSAHEILTLASIVELEGSNSSDRAGVAGVFYNRLNDPIDFPTLGSDVTTYYAVKKEFKDDLYQVDLDSCNGYNTRGTCVKGLPVGPIASPSLESIVAAIEPKEHDYLYFVADVNKKTYFSKTSDEHIQVVNQLKRDGLWNEN